jgi:hypothetical protein
MDYLLHKQAAVPLTMSGRACCEKRSTPQGVSWRLMASRGRERWEGGRESVEQSGHGIEASMAVKLSMALKL